MSTPSSSTSSSPASSGGGGRTALTVVAWLWVLIPFLYGVYSLLLKIPALF
jgi:hypothetical protein